MRKCRDRFARKLLHLRRIGNIDPTRQHSDLAGAPELLGQRAQAHLIDVAQRQIAATQRELLRQRTSDTARRTRQGNSLAWKLDHWDSLLMYWWSDPHVTGKGKGAANLAIRGARKHQPVLIYAYWTPFAPSGEPGSGLFRYGK